MINAEKVLENYEKNKAISTYQTTYSPLFSSIGLSCDEEFSGIKDLFLHYNRSTKNTWKNFMAFAGELKKVCCDSEKIRLLNENKKVTLSFYKRNSFLVSCENVDEVTLCEEKDGKLTDIFTEYREGKISVLHGYSKNTDERDPDETVPFLFGIEVKTGELTEKENGFVVKPADGKILFAVTVEMLNFSLEEILGNLNEAPETVEEAEKITADWVKECLKDLNLPERSEKENALVMKAISGFLYNFTVGEGKLDKHMSVYPNRGAYPTHFLWDTCFQNLALEKMNLDLNEDTLLQFAENQRSDGKYPQFLCSTWDRPSYTQPALVGWAVIRYLKCVKEKGIDLNTKKDFTVTMLSSLERNNEWWLKDRMTRFGVICCLHGLETGQDDSPRFDNGATLACDMNGYLLNQMRATAKLAEMLGKEERKVYWEKKASDLSRAMADVLFDEESGFFFDCDVKTGEKIPVLCCSAFMPLWAGVELPEEKCKKMIESYLLNEKYFFGQVPFPSIAYCDSTYESSLWWRGPVWLPTAEILLETLQKYGYEKEAKEASRRLYKMLADDGDFREHYDSATGEGEGSFDQGWTQAVFIKLFCEQ